MTSLNHTLPCREVDLHLARLSAELTAKLGTGVLVELLEDSALPGLLLSDLRGVPSGEPAEFVRLLFDQPEDLCCALEGSARELESPEQLHGLRCVHRSKGKVGHPIGPFRLEWGQEPEPPAFLAKAGPLPASRIKACVEHLGGRFGELEVLPPTVAGQPQLRLTVTLEDILLAEALWTFKDDEHLARFLEQAVLSEGFCCEEQDAVAPVAQQLSEF